MKEYINLTRKEINDNFPENSHTKWKFLKYVICKFIITYLKTKAKNSHKKIIFKKQVEILEQNANPQNDKTENEMCKHELNTIYAEKIAGTKLRKRCGWHEFGEKSDKSF